MQQTLENLRGQTGFFLYGIIEWLKIKILLRKLWCDVEKMSYSTIANKHILASKDKRENTLDQKVYIQLKYQKYTSGDLQQR